MTSLRAAVLTFLLLSLLGFHMLCAPVALYDTAVADIACMAELALAQAPDHQWDAELQQLLQSSACASANSAMQATSASAVSYKGTGAQSAQKPNNDSDRNVSTEAGSEVISTYLRGTDKGVSSYYTPPNVPHLFAGMSFGLLSSAK